MAIFNEVYTCDVLSEKNNDIEVIEEAAGIGIGILATIFVSTFALVTGVIVKSTKDGIKNIKSVEKALKVYPEIHKDCKPLYKFRKKIYTIKPYTDEPGEESIPKSRIEKFMRKHKLDYGDKCICYFDDSNKLAMYYCYRISGDVNITTYNIKTFICDSKYKEHREYYITHFLTDRGMTNGDCENWAKKVLNDYEALKNKKES